MPRTWKRHSSDEIVAKLDRAGALLVKGASIAEAAVSIGVTLPTYFRWRKQYSGLRASQLRYIKELEVEVVRLRKAIRDIESGAAA